MEDLRINEISFSLNNQAECEEVFRELCSHHKVSIAKAKAFTDAQSVIKDVNVFKLCRLLNLRIEVDFLKESFSVHYPEEADKLVSFPGQEEIKAGLANELSPDDPGPSKPSEEDEELF